MATKVEELETKFNLIQNSELANKIAKETYIKLADENLTDDEMRQLIHDCVRAKYSNHVLSCKKIGCTPYSYKEYAEDMRNWTFNKLKTVARIKKLYTSALDKDTSKMNKNQRYYQKKKMAEAKKEADNTDKETNKATNKAKTYTSVDIANKMVARAVKEDIVESINVQNVQIKTKQNTSKVIVGAIKSSDNSQSNTSSMSEAEYKRLEEQCRAAGWIK